jgi:hypothetical protein
MSRSMSITTWASVSIIAPDSRRSDKGFVLDRTVLLVAIE